eukprot:9466517-Karenia_brevis.AAC.2
MPSLSSFSSSSSSSSSSCLSPEKKAAEGLGSTIMRTRCRRSPSPKSSPSSSTCRYLDPNLAQLGPCVRRHQAHFFSLWKGAISQIAPVWVQSLTK